MSRVLVLTGAVSAVMGLMFFLATLGAARRRRWQRTLARGLAALFFTTLAALLATVAVSIRGYRALTHEEVAATIRTWPTGTQRLLASVTYPDGRSQLFEISGDAIYIDAHILKWKPWVNILGLHTLYELDRVAGRFDGLADERDKPRSVYSIARQKPVDLFDVVKRYPRRLSILIDAEYGSATFVGVRGPAAYEILVSTSGLLARPVAGP